MSFENYKLFRVLCVCVIAISVWFYFYLISWRSFSPPLIICHSNRILIFHRAWCSKQQSAKKKIVTITMSSSASSMMMMMICCRLFLNEFLIVVTTTTTTSKGRWYSHCLAWCHNAKERKMPTERERVVSFCIVVILSNHFSSLFVHINE